MTRRLLAALAALALISTPPAAAQAPSLPEGTLVVAVAVSDGVTLLPVAGFPVVSLVCVPVGP